MIRCSATTILNRFKTFVVLRLHELCRSLRRAGILQRTSTSSASFATNPNSLQFVAQIVTVWPRLSILIPIMRYFLLLFHWSYISVSRTVCSPECKNNCFGAGPEHPNSLQFVAQIVTVWPRLSILIPIMRYFLLLFHWSYISVSRTVCSPECKNNCFGAGPEHPNSLQFVAQIVTVWPRLSILIPIMRYFLLLFHWSYISVSRTVCSPECKNNCFGAGPEHCCYQECMGGCHGPGNRECWVRAGFLFSFDSINTYLRLTSFFRSVKTRIAEVLPHGPLARYVKLCVAHAPGMPGTFSPPPTSKEPSSWRSRHASWHVRHARAVMHVGIANLRSWRKHSQYSRRFRNPQCYAAGKRPIGDTDLFTSHKQSYSRWWLWNCSQKSRKCVSKCCLQTDGHFRSTLMRSLL